MLSFFKRKIIKNEQKITLDEFHFLLPCASCWTFTWKSWPAVSSQLFDTNRKRRAQLPLVLWFNYSFRVNYSIYLIHKWIILFVSIEKVIFSFWNGLKWMFQLTVSMEFMPFCPLYRHRESAKGVDIRCRSVKNHKLQLARIKFFLLKIETHREKRTTNKLQSFKAHPILGKV